MLENRHQRAGCPGYKVMQTFITRFVKAPVGTWGKDRVVQMNYRLRLGVSNSISKSKLI
jgi:hypothetical protein